MSKEQGEPNLETKRKKKIKFQDKEQRRPTLRKIAKERKSEIEIVNNRHVILKQTTNTLKSKESLT
jgi:hypothetical protein